MIAPEPATGPASATLIRPPRTRLARVPELTALFWVLKVLTTGMGETASDYLAHTIGPVIAVGLSGVALLAALTMQLVGRV